MAESMEKYRGRIPSYMLDGFQEYVLAGRPMGGFGSAVLTNNFTETVARADDQNRHCLRAIAMFVVNELPMRCWGSKKEVDAWTAAHAELRTAAMATK